MAGLELPDLCAHIDRLTLLCNRLEKAQSDDQRYREIEKQIRNETDALHAVIRRMRPSPQARTQPAPTDRRSAEG